MPKYISRVYIIVEADSADDAQDAMSSALSDRLQDGGAILDWCYTQHQDGGFTHPLPLPPHGQAVTDFRDEDVDLLFVAARISAS